MKKKRRRVKGSGSVSYLGEGRRKPYVATYEKKSIGTFQFAEEAELALLKHQLEISKSYPTFLGEVDFLKTEYARFLFEFQKKGTLDMLVNNLKDIDFYNNLFKDRMILMGNTLLNIDTKQELILSDIPSFSEIWEIEFERLSRVNSDSWKRSMSAAFKSLKSLHDLPVNQIKTNEFQNAFDIRSKKRYCGKSTLNNMLHVCRLIIKYAIKMDYIEKDYTQFINTVPTSEPRNKRKPFTVEEIKTLIADETDIAKKILIYIFTGARPIELITMKRCDIHLDENYMIGGVKTKAGKMRIIPIHSYIKQYIEYFNDRYRYTYFFSESYTEMDYIKYNKEFKECMIRLKLDHTEPYDTRYTFSTLAKVYHVDTAAHKKIMGHVCNDITDDIYTHEPLEYLLHEIEKIKI